MFVAVFQPLQTFLVAVMAALIFGDQLYSGGYAENSQSQVSFSFSPLLITNIQTDGFQFKCRVMGAILIVLGLYFVLWGKTNQKRVTNSEEPSITKPLLNGEGDVAPKDIP